LKNISKECQTINSTPKRQFRLGNNLGSKTWVQSKCIHAKRLRIHCVNVHILKNFSHANTWARSRV
jgi:hypothetical protein